jgi:hypothetical protein
MMKQLIVCQNLSSLHNGANNAEMTCDGHMTTDSNSAAADCGDVTTSQCTTNTVMACMSTPSCQLQQTETYDTTTNGTTMDVIINAELADTTSHSDSVLGRNALTSVIQRDCGNSCINSKEAESSSQTVSAAASAAVITDTAIDDKQSSSATPTTLQIDESNYSHDNVAISSTKTDTSINTDQNVVMTSSQSDTTCNSWRGDHYAQKHAVANSNQNNNSVARSGCYGTTANEVSTYKSTVYTF